MTKPRPSKWDQMDQLRAQTGYAGELIPENAFSVAEYAAKYGPLSGRAAASWLETKMLQGYLCRGKKRTVPGNHLAWFYWKNPSKALDA